VATLRGQKALSGRQGGARDESGEGLPARVLFPSWSLAPAVRGRGKACCLPGPAQATLTLAYTPVYLVCLSL